MYWSRDRQINDLTSEWTGSGELCWMSSLLPLWRDPVGPRAPAWYSQAEPLHHALPRLGWRGAGIGSRFDLTGEGVAGERGGPVRTELGKWTDLNPHDSLASFERKALTVQSQDMDYVVLWQRSEGTDLTTRFYKLTSMPPSLKCPLVYRLRLFSSTRLKTHGFAGSGCITSWLLLFPWLFSAYGWARERITSSPISSNLPLPCVSVCVCAHTCVCVCIYSTYCLSIGNERDICKWSNLQ